MLRSETLSQDTRTHIHTHTKLGTEEKASRFPQSRVADAAGHGHCPTVPYKRRLFICSDVKLQRAVAGSARGLASKKARRALARALSDP
eukprot:2730536-Amphidinium_carterae.1